MATVLSTLYPPLVSDFMPAFLASESATVQFSISPYNSIGEIKRLHVSLVYQYTNIKEIKNKELNASSNNNGQIINNIWIIDMSNSTYIQYNQVTKMYTLTIPKRILKNESFSTEGYYKLQLRFDEFNGKIGEDYLIANRNKFSEWSSVCLLKAIPDVSILLSNFDLSNGQTDIPTFNTGIIPITGEVVFENNLNGTKAETLRSYEITIYNKIDPTDILDSSGVIYAANQIDLNRIYWLAGAENAIPGTTYVVKIDITTKNQYTTSKTYELSIFNYDATPFNVEWNFKRSNLEQYNITTDGKIITEEDGIVQCTVSTTSTMPPGYLYIKRASNLDNFKKWELISCTKHNAGLITHTFSDATVGSLVQYQYSAQYQLTTEAWTQMRKSSDIVYPNFYDILLSRDGKQLAIRYKESISSLKPVVNRQKVDTLGGKYPKFVENAQMNYKQFSISGLIDAESDYNRKFLDDRDYASAMSVYDSEMNGRYEIRNDTIADEEYAYQNTTDSKKIRSHKNTVHDLYPKDNWWWERKFREEAIKWLNDGEPKLFRSMPEGNMTVMLTDISLTPEPTIGRRLYNFSATMYEIEDGYSLETLSSLGIVTITNEKEAVTGEGEDISVDTIIKNGLGQMSSQEMRPNPDMNPPSAVVINRQLNTSMDGNSCGLKGFDYNHTNIGDFYRYIVYDKDSALGKKFEVIPDSIVLTDLQINFESPPKWWAFSGNTISAVDEDDPSGEANLTKALGYKIQLVLEGAKKGEDKTVDIFVNEKGYYQTPHNLKVIGLNIYGNAIATLDYKIEYQITYNTSDIPSSTRSQGTLVGQLSGVWNPGSYIAEKIQEKHRWSKVNEGKIVFQEFLSDWTALSLEITPYTIFSLKFKGDEYNTYVVGRTGIYNLSEDFDIENLYIIGRRMVLVDKERQPHLDEWEYVLDNSALEFDGTVINSSLEDAANEQAANIDSQINTNSLLGQENLNRIWDNLFQEDSTVLRYTSNNQVLQPKYNTVYGIVEDGVPVYKLYYIDGGWYDIEFLDNSREIAIAKVPVHGMINYQGTVVQQKFS